MKWVSYSMLVLALAVLCVLLWHFEPRGWTKDSQFAAGEWKIEVQTPPCDSVHNIQVIYPAQSGYPITIECDSMAVSTK